MSVVYFMRRENDGLIKIGTTTAISERFRALDREHGATLEILGVMEGDKRLESDLHLRFSRSRVEGEWFSPSIDLLDYIKTFSVEWDGIGEKPVRVDLPPDVHDLLRLVAAYRRVSMAALAREFVERMVRDEAKERGIR